MNPKHDAIDAGTTFLVCSSGPNRQLRLDDHLWIVLSDPSLDSERILIVNLTSAAPWKEGVCVLHPSDHAWIRHETYVSYKDAKVVSKAWLEERLANKSIRLEEQATSELLAKVRNAAANSARMDMGLAEILLEQDLIDYDAI